MGLSQEFIRQLLQEETQTDTRLYKHGFDKSCLFYLSLPMDNLFEPWRSEWYASDGLWWRCKGCSRKVKRTGRESHHEWHRRELL